MALLFTNVGDGLTRDGSFLDPAQDWTRAQWIWLSASAPVNYQVVWQLGGAPFGGDPSPETPPLVGSFTDSVAHGIYSGGNNGGGFLSDDGVAWTLGAWQYVVTRYNATTKVLSTRVDTITSTGSPTLDLSAVPAQSGEWLGTDIGVSVGGIGAAYPRVWQALLSNSELDDERVSQTPVRTADLLAASTLKTLSALNDTTGNGHGWSTVGSTITVIADPPVFGVTPYVAQIFETDRIDFLQPNLTPIGSISGIGQVRACCAMSNGECVVLTGDNTGINTIIRIDPITCTVLGTATPGVSIANLSRPGNRMQEHRPSGDLIIGTGTAVVRLRTDGTLVTTYGLNASDFAISRTGRYLLYASANVLQLWDLSNDVSAGVWRTFTETHDGNPVDVRYPCWLGDCTAVCALVPGAGSYPSGFPPADIIRVPRTGARIATYPNPPGAATNFDEWPIGVAADDTHRRVWALGDYDEFPDFDDAIYLKEYDLDTAEELNTLVYGADDVTDAVGQLAALQAGAPCNFNPPQELLVSCPATTAWRLNIPYSSSFGATGGVPPYSFSVAAGALPTGLTLDTSTGDVTGTPSVLGLFSFTAEVTDADSTTATHSCSITISASNPSAGCVINFPLG